MINFLYKSFTAHPKHIGEGYWQHFWFATKKSLCLAKIALCLFLHALFPFIFVTYAKEQIQKFNNMLQTRSASDALPNHTFNIISENNTNTNTPPNTLHITPSTIDAEA